MDESSIDEVGQMEFDEANGLDLLNNLSNQKEGSMYLLIDDIVDNGSSYSMVKYEYSKLRLFPDSKTMHRFFH